MHKLQLTRKDVLKQIETHQLSSADGLRLIQQITSASAGPSQPEQEVSRVMYFRREWEKTEIAREESGQAVGDILIFDGDGKICSFLNEQLENRTEAHSRVTLVQPGECYRRLGTNAYEINPESKDDYRRLFEDLRTERAIPNKILYMWTRRGISFDKNQLSRELSLGLFSIFLCSKALIELRIKNHIDFLYVYTGNEKTIQPQHSGVSGFARTLRQEHPNFSCSTVAVDEPTETECAAIVLREILAGNSTAEISYRQSERYVRRLKPVESPLVDQQINLRENGVYIITGGVGGLGKKFAEHIAGQVKARLVLAGRSALSAEQAAWLEELNASGADVFYCQADISKREDVERLVQETKARFNTVHGVIHCAGIIRDALTLKKSIEDMSAVLAPKVYGSVWLDEVTQDDQLDFFVLFSSVAATFGSVGQCDYAYANSFMDGFAEWRELLRTGQKRCGKTIAINWPLWQDGGMTVDENAQTSMRESGVELLCAADGLRAFHDALGSVSTQQVVLYGKRKSLESLVISNRASEAREHRPKATLSEDEKAALMEKTEVCLKEILAREAKLPLSKIRSQEPLENLGIDSLLIMTLTRELEKLFGELPKTLFFEYQTLAELTEYFVEHHREVIQTIVGSVSQPRAGKSKINNAQKEPASISLNRLTAPQMSDASNSSARHDDIAIIGVGGRYPMADDLAQFWENLKTGRDCITEIPPDRWDYSKYFDADKKKLGKSYSKWGGFINDVDKFDPLFFNISPAEAELIDPQERLFLETVWQTIEDAGYTRTQLNRTRAGVFVGVMYGHYQLFSAENSLQGDGLVFGSSFASIANRASYFFNFKGPSIALDTMCSSSLTAIHLACRSISLGECELAIAGGVNVSIHPQKYQLLSQGRFAASDGRCRSFGEGGDGYVPGEGVGALLLKPLRQAVADRDQIYGVIKGSSINHGGKTNGYTVPNPKAQEELITEALRSAKLDSSRISYIEAHGTGTTLGDPIEIAGLTRAFKTSSNGNPEQRVETNSCPIGSVKSNIGHLESAAGIAAVTKVLLQFKHRQLVPSIHSNRINPNVNLSETPFFVQQELAEWKQPAMLVSGEEIHYSRQAGVSGFGAGGANAHVILEEYVDNTVADEESDGQPQIIVISAKTQARLKDYAARYLHFLNRTREDSATVNADKRGALVGSIQKDLLTFASALVNVTEQEIDPDDSLGEFGFDRMTVAKLAEQIRQKYDCEIIPSTFSDHSSISAIARLVSEKYAAHLTNSFSDKPEEIGDGISINLADLAYTLQVGREAMRERLAMVVSDRRELCDKLQRYCEGDTEDEHLYLGSFIPGASTPERLVEGRAGKEFIRLLVDDREWDKLAQLWVSGVEINWPQLHDQTRAGHRLPRRISVPTYPFARDRYWVPEPQQSAVPLTRLHPLIDRNISTLSEISFTTHLSCDEPYLLDQGNGRFMPELAMIEMARAAAELAQDRAVARINNIRWGLPVVAPENALDLRVSLLPTGDAVEFEVSSNVEPHGLRAHGQGVLVYENGPESKQINELVDIEAVKWRCPDTRSSEQCYEYLRGVGLNYSQEQRVVRELFFDDDDALVCFDLSPEETTEFFLNPLMLDGLMQAAAIWLPAIGQPSGQLRPTSLNEIDLKRPLTRAAYAYLKLASNQGVAESQEKDLTVRFVDPAGQVLVKLTALTLKVQQTQTQILPAKPVLVAPTNGTSIRPQLESQLQKMAAELIKMAPEQLEVNSGLGDFGFESVTFVELADKLSQLLEVEVAPTVFFECDTIRGLSNYLLKEFGERVKSLFTNVNTATVTGEMVVAHAESPDGSESLVPLVQRHGGQRNYLVGSVGQNREAIAVIGMSGVFPGSKDLNEFWENLRDEKDLITEIPADRWNWRDYHADFSNGQFKTQAKWGGFIEDADKFDARFFNISPLEAEMMDPQQRVFLETVWKAIEDGGYKASEFSGRRVGLFVGVQFSDYQQMLASQGLLNAQMGLGNEHSILVNRISYLLNLRGPSEPYNTACSSALVAVHRAVNSIRSGEAELAIAGGISLMLSPFTTISGDSLGVLSVDGRCKTLDTSANGYVRGEGAGALMLKPLERALADNDNIYAVIKGTAVNHGGKASSLTAPNSDAQAALLVQAYEEADVDPESVSYLELHGTGTKLGDPIEIEGIKKAFKQLGERRQKKHRRTQYCGIGSVKTNIGHLEPASGIAGMAKLILSMKHRTLPALLHLKDLNPYVKLQNTPFYVVDRTRVWEQLRDENEQLVPRCAGVSSFGFGGVNAHIVLQEHEASPSVSDVRPQLIVLSAKNEERLLAYTEKLLTFLNQETPSPNVRSLADMAYTLQVGREEFSERLAVVASNTGELRDKLSRYLAADLPAEDLYRGKVKAKKTDEVSESEQERVNRLIANRDVHRLAEHWVSGGEINWTQLYADNRPRRMSLPTYPFERKRYWALKGELPVVPMKAAANSEPSKIALTAEQPASEQFEDYVLQELMTIFSEELKTDVDSMEPETDFTEFGVDSILASVIVQRIRERFGDAITLSAIVEYPTLRELAAYVREEGQHQDVAPVRRVISVAKGTNSAVIRSTSQLPPELVPLNLKGNQQTSFWVHGGVGYAALYTNLSKALGPDYPFYAFQAKGVDGKSIPRDFEEMIAHYTHCIRLAQPAGPYVIGGYSYGGLVAYEIARRMHLEGDKIAHLVLFDTLPSVEEAFNIFLSQYGSDDNFLTMMMGNEFAGAKKAGRPLITMADIENVPEKLRLGRVAHLAKERGQTAMSADEIYNYIRGSIKLCDYTEATYRTYRAEPYEGSDVLYFQAEKFLSNENWIGTEAHDIFRDYDYIEPWRQLTKGDVRVVRLPCDHFNMLEEPALSTSAEYVRAMLTSQADESKQARVA
ncbi:MAG TPA: SDR family NAD(P)-dependent oxidoreductase [Pyrinomonadaceae bacterium]|nr:SDR family NAD(P)-dependent oxidoreductase [Pyrinomonadaceae bacterium]